MIDRIALIDSFPSVWGPKKKGDHSRLKFLTVIIIIFNATSVLTLGFLLLGILGPLVGLGNNIWQNSAGLVLFLGVWLLSFQRAIFERLLIKHKERIKEKANLDTVSIQNEGLNDIIENIWPLKGRRKILLLSLYTPIWAMACWQMFLGIDESPSNPYWEYVKFPFLLLIGIILLNFIRDYQKLVNNIKQVEAEMENAVNT